MSEVTRCEMGVCIYCGIEQMTAFYPRQSRPYGNGRRAFRAVPGQWCNNPACDKPSKIVTMPEGDALLIEMEVEAEELQAVANVPAQQPDGIMVTNWPGVGQPVKRVEKKA